MNTSTYLIIYLSICALAVIAIPAVRNQWKDFIKSIPQNYRVIEKGSYNKMIKVFLFIIFPFVMILFFILTPLLLPLLIKYNRHTRNIDKKTFNKEEVKDNNLYFWKTNGVGNIQCLDCNYQEKIVSFIHGFDSSSTGLQCQSCGKFHALNDWSRCIDNNEPIYCECGGILEREEPIFCSKCTSKNIKYRTHFMT
ncbi:hypothetical protein CLV62_10328 [Dysgonomonas alginatilytica]|uniref:Uncharacterized protein n=1 Tax=Dysgonomonas alginatilytica TaxID=1605892 RepID=A0A2V3PRY9_9BACT|nr:hypothetical protein [Dysgonomonas alginatilytica]PXV67355.1 hypothetical protein CLV62_10328 [Dysgonomonas alginatilytica]